MSYRKTHVKNKIHKIKPKRPIFLKLWFWILLLFVIIIFSAAYFLLFYPGLQVKNVIISGNDKITTQELQAIILNNANTGLLKFGNIDLISSSIFLVDTNKLNKEILKKFPLIEKITINKNLPQTLTLGVTERKPVGIYCAGSSGDNQQCFFIDENGVIFENIVPGGLNMDYPIVRQTLSDDNLFTGESVVGQNIVVDISQIQKDLRDNFQIDVKEALVTSPLRMDITTGGGWKIYFNLSNDPNIDAQITKLNLLLNGDVNPNVRKTLQYIDLRFKDRAYYK